MSVVTDPAGLTDTGTGEVGEGFSVWGEALSCGAVPDSAAAVPQTHVAGSNAAKDATTIVATHNAVRPITALVLPTPADKCQVMPFRLTARAIFAEVGSSFKPSLDLAGARDPYQVGSDWGRSMHLIL